MSTRLRTHPAYGELVRRYRAAREAWAGSKAMQEAAGLLAMDERSYCNAHIVNHPPILWTGSSTVVAPITAAHLDAAYRDAGVCDRLPPGYPPRAEDDEPFEVGRE